MMELLFYRATYGKKLDKVIAFWTGGPFSHVELRFSDGVCFSSSARDGGTRFKDIEVLPERWEILKLKHNDAESEIRQWCQKRVGLPYDYCGVFGLALGQKKIEEQKKWYCSEVVATALKKFQALDIRSTRVNPNHFYKFLISRDSDVEEAY